MATRWPLTIERTNERLVELPRWSAPKGDDWFRAYGSEGDALVAVTVMAVDPASGLAGRDAIGVAVLSITPAGFGIIRHLEGVRATNKKDAMRRVATIARDYMASVLVVEELKDGFFGETLEGELVILGYPMTVEKVTTGGQQKGRRIIESLAPPMGAGRLCILESVASSDHGGEFVNQLVRISYDGRTGSAKDHDDSVDALAHCVFRVKDSLISDVADNRSEHHISQLDRWSRVPLRYGGLGNHDVDTYGASKRTYIGNMDSTRTYADAILEDDEVLISLQQRRDRLQESVNEDLVFGRRPDEQTIRKIRALTGQIKELKELNVF
jgi:hypothetical protein